MLYLWIPSNPTVTSGLTLIYAKLQTLFLVRKMKKIIENAKSEIAREAIQIAELVWAVQHNENPRLHVYLMERGWEHE